MRWRGPRTQSIRLSGVCLSLKRILKAARASPGITLVAALPTSMVVKASVEGSKCSLPLSSLCAASCGHQLGQHRDGILGLLRIADMALHAGAR